MGFSGERGDTRVGTRTRGKRLESVRVPLRGECDLETIVTSSMLRIIHSVEALVRMFQTLDS